MALRLFPCKRAITSPWPNAAKCSTLANTHCENHDELTHTGQSWNKNDYRQVRFLNLKKLVNPNWSLKLIKEVPPVAVEGRVAVCEGGPSEALGHPKIFINLDQPGEHSCIYCGLRYYKKLPR